MTAPAEGPGPSGAADGQPGGALPSPLDSVDDMRAAAKWTLAAAGAVGAALISGGPLVAVGQVHGFWHTFLAWLGLVVVLAGVGVAIWSTSRVLVPRLTTPNVVRRDKDLESLRVVIAAEPTQFMGFSATSVDGLFKRQELLRERIVRLTDEMRGAPDDARRAGFRAQLDQAHRNSQAVDAYVRWVLALGHAWLVRADLERSRRWTLAGGVIVAFGAVMFLSVTGSSGPAYVPVVTTSPTASAPATPAPPP